MKKYAIILGCNIHWAPYYYRYERLLCEKGIPFDLIMWNREGLEEKTSARIIEYKEADQSCSNNPKKISKFVRFARFVKRVVKKNKYDKLLFLGLQGCALTLNTRYFTKYYHYKYWVDIRDYHYEWFKPYYLLEKKVIKHAYKTCISSRGFQSFLPSNDYLYIHNVDPNMDSVVKNYESVESTQVRISFIGNVRYYEENCKLIDLFANDSRFVLQFFGPGHERIEMYCKEKKVHNVLFHGRFNQDETVGFYCRTDIINNIYGNSTKEVTTALSNKLYYSIRLHIPIIVSSKTYMEEFCKEYGIAISFEYEKNFPDKLFAWYKSFEKQEHVGFDKAWEVVSKEDSLTQRELMHFLEG